MAICPGLPSLEVQEIRDNVPSGTYMRACRTGCRYSLRKVGEYPSVSDLVDLIRAWQPQVILCDRFRLPEVMDANPPCLVTFPVFARWSESTEDIGHLRRLAADGPLSIGAASQALLGASLSVCRVLTDDGGSVRLRKSADNKARDDVGAALILAAGEWARRVRTTAPEFHYQPPPVEHEWVQ